MGAPYPVTARGTTRKRERDEGRWNGVHTLTTVILMGAGVWTYDDRAAELVARTGREGPAKRLGHDLVLRWRHWHAEVDHDGPTPTAVRVTVPLDGLEVVRGEGGVKSLSGPEKVLARRQALKVLGGRKHPTIEFHGDEVEAGDAGWTVMGTLRVNGGSALVTVDVRPDGDGLVATATVRHSDLGVQRVKLAAGALSVADEVRVRVEGLSDPTRGTSDA
jgi:hypothetical protein